MTCEQRDSELLLLAHRQLGALSSFRTELHVRRCPRCRGRLAEFGKVSGVLAAALGPRDGERPKAANPRPSVSTVPTGSILAVLGLIVVIGIGLYVAGRSTVQFTPQPPASKPHAAIGCRPGIVSDKCR